MKIINTNEVCQVGDTFQYPVIPVRPEWADRLRSYNEESYTISGGLVSFDLAYWVGKEFIEAVKNAIGGYSIIVWAQKCGTLPRFVSVELAERYQIQWAKHMLKELTP